jgi:hypothetical protein
LTQYNNHTKTFGKEIPAGLWTACLSLRVDAVFTNEHLHKHAVAWRSTDLSVQLGSLGVFVLGHFDSLLQKRQPNQVNQLPHRLFMWM